MHPVYYNWLFHTEQFADEFYKWGYGIVDDLWSTHWSEMKKIMVIYPPLSTQAAIAAYLDVKCATIDGVIAEAKASIEEYKAWKASVIFEAVTKGLNPDVKMVDSGMEWIGQIPQEWEIIPFGKIATIKACLVNPEMYPSLPQISPENIEKGSARLMDTFKSVKDAGVISWNHLFHKGQIIYSKVRPTLNKLFLAQFDGLCSADMYPIETTQNTNFIVYAMLSESFVQQVAAITTNRVKMPKINKQEISKIVILLPPHNEQASIADYLDEKCASIDAVIAEKEALIAELETYKKSLIFETVTGKRRVC
jgi:type I restriction enzyme S subunit